MNYTIEADDPNANVTFTTGPTLSYTGFNTAICPDLLRLSDLGEADNWRGRVVRGFFRLLRLLTGI